MIKLIVSDLDGTLLKYDNEFNYESYQKIKELEKKGVELMFATGRDYWMVEDICQKYDIYNPMILNNGTQYRTYNGEVNHYYPMERDAFEKVMNILMSYHYHISVHTQKGKYIFEDIEKYFPLHAREFFFLMEGSHNGNFIYDKGLDVLIVGNNNSKNPAL